ncbi:hypothetical protein PF001_g12782 [Phytophthora fragariae]|uniref:Uncharacterized protein n=1 Tax=Phytophthora fragariae TaxID=53985 RepID=A0A6A4DGB1_9STRA|nr:hypothetical protein PF001_g12782 [Phytophthora fragariae]
MMPCGSSMGRKTSPCGWMFLQPKRETSMGMANPVPLGAALYPKGECMSITLCCLPQQLAAECWCSATECWSRLLELTNLSGMLVVVVLVCSCSQGM